MKIARLCILFFTISYGSITFAVSAIITAQHFSIIQQLITHDKDPSHTLLVLDDDDTLTMMPCPSPSHCQYLGGPAWFTWQANLPKNNADRIYDSFSQLVDINNLIFWVSQMPLVEPDIPNVLKTAHHLKMPIVIASARSFDMIPATEKQLSGDGILTVIEASALRTPKNNISFAGYYIPSGATRAIAYQNGILYLAGQNKGVMLRSFLKKTHQDQRIHKIIFVDDTYQNDFQVANAYKNDVSKKVICVYYTYLKTHQEAFLTGKHAKKLQAIANQQWYVIYRALKKNLSGLSL